ncbi:ferrochelatase [Nakamurella panacisegetis]|uniref:Coproporphyrin III ferrochelatase n=1 Tax=Nakamurella panacisegetis TaxID=1090615 RepID=A0A1H0HTK0_9ACTN|nr:ferrochelatase [Nakamurella panacisegetis]SDO22468.1 ferrochelatase [Nakamurella panacisegetis]
MSGSSPDLQTAGGVSPSTLEYDAVLLAGFGGPEGPDEVMPFLRNVTRGRGIPDERLVEVSHHYQALDGISPINEQNRRLRAALQAELERRGVRVPVLWGNRNWAPFIADVVAQAARDGQVRLLGLATSAYSSYSSCRQYREDFGLALQSTGLVGTVRIDKVRPYHDRPGFIDPFIDGAKAAVAQALSAGLALEDLELVFTTHSIPMTMAASAGSASLGDHTPTGAYVDQHLAVCGVVASALESWFGRPLSWQLAYQSRSGPPSMPWLEPDVNDVISGLPALGRRGVVVIPVGFVSDHVEVVWDLDNEALDTATSLGLWFHRVATPGTDPRFVSALVDLLMDRLEPALAPPRISATGCPARPDFCAAQCCVNARGPKPTTAAVDSAADWQQLDVDPARLAASGIRNAP